MIWTIDVTDKFVSVVYMGTLSVTTKLSDLGGTTPELGDQVELRINDKYYTSGELVGKIIFGDSVSLILEENYGA